MSAIHPLQTFGDEGSLALDTEEATMLLLPHLREVLLGPVGLGLVFWFVMVVWLGVSRRVSALGILLALTAVALGVAAAGAFEMSAVRYSPNRYMPMITSGLFLTFSLAAFVSGTVALGLVAPLFRAVVKGSRRR